MNDIPEWIQNYHLRSRDKIEPSISSLQRNQHDPASGIIRKIDNSMVTRIGRHAPVVSHEAPLLLSDGHFNQVEQGGELAKDNCLDVRVGISENIEALVNFGR